MSINPFFLSTDRKEDKEKRDNDERKNENE